MRKKIDLMLAVSAIAALVISGCILTATGVVTVKLVPDEYGQSLTIRNVGYTENGRIVVNLSEDEDFEELREHISNIDNLGFYLSVTNKDYPPVTFQILIDSDTLADYSDIDMIVDSSDLIFTGLEIPAGSPFNTEKTIINWSESMEYITGLSDVKSILETGVFSIYPLAIPRDNFNLTIDSLVIIVTLTGKK
ncbi:MAG: hypothetical protein V3V99_15040 [candidate division Zixibacteria bacterium]